MGVWDSEVRSYSCYRWHRYCTATAAAVSAVAGAKSKYMSSPLGPKQRGHTVVAMALVNPLLVRSCLEGWQRAVATGTNETKKLGKRVAPALANLWDGWNNVVVADNPWFAHFALWIRPELLSGKSIQWWLEKGITNFIVTSLLRRIRESQIVLSHFYILFSLVVPAKDEDLVVKSLHPMTVTLVDDLSSGQVFFG